MSNSSANGTNLVGSNGLLVSWKQIAAHLGHTVRTVQRWEREAELPVHRRGTGKKPTIFAYESELDAWLNQNAETATRSGASLGGDRRVVWLAVAALVVAIAGFGWTLVRSDSSASSESLVGEPIALTSDSGLTGNPAVSPDGKWLAYVSDRDGGESLDLWVQPFPLPRGESPRRITNKPGHVRKPDFSPDSTRVAYEMDYDSLAIGTSIYPPRSIYVVSLADNSDRWIASGMRPKFSPDGQQVAFRFGREYYVVSADGGEPRAITSEFAVADRVAWLPDSERLMVWGSRSRRDPREAWIVSVNGDRTTQTGSESLGRVRWPSRWTSKHDRVLLARSGDLWLQAFSPETYRLEGNPVHLPRLPTANARYTRPIGDKLVFQADESNADVWSLPVDPHGAATGPARRLTDHATQAFSATVSWDGSKITYRLRDKDGLERAWFKDLATGKDHALQPRREPSDPPMISPDGSRVAFTAEAGEGPRRPRNTRRSELFVAPTDGGAARRVCGDCGYATGWTPDGKGVLTVVRNIADKRSEILRVDAESGKTSTLLSCQNCRLESSTLSRNGRWLLFENRDDKGRSRVMVAPYGDGSEMIPESAWRTLIDGEGGGFAKPVFSPDQSLLYFISHRVGYTCIWARALDSVTAEPRGDSFPVRHFHEFAQSMATTPKMLAAAPGQLIFHLYQTSGNIWMYENVSLN